MGISVVPVATPEAPLGVSPSRSVVGEVPRAPGVLPEPLAGEPFVRGVRASVEEVGHACGVAMEVACADEACSVSVDAPRDGTLASAVWFAERPRLVFDNLLVHGLGFPKTSSPCYAAIDGLLGLRQVAERRDDFGWSICFAEEGARDLDICA